MYVPSNATKRSYQILEHNVKNLFIALTAEEMAVVRVIKRLGSMYQTSKCLKYLSEMYSGDQELSWTMEALGKKLKGAQN